jgi:cell shape-determining protein MreC
MIGIVENIKAFNNKLQQLLKQYQQLQKENEQLKSIVSELKISRENDLLRISQLEQQAGILKSAAGKMEETDKKIFERQINQYIREIDKCIALLSE